MYLNKFAPEAGFELRCVARWEVIVPVALDIPHVFRPQNVRIAAHFVLDHNFILDDVT